MKEGILIIKLVVFTVLSDKLKVFISNYLLPSGGLNNFESLDSAAKRIFHEKVGISLSNNYFEQLCTLAEIVNSESQVSVIYYLLIPGTEISASLISGWVEPDKKKINIGDFEIIQYAIQRLRWKIEYTNVVYSLLPVEFTLSELQGIYEAILGKSLDKRNFRKKILSLGLVKSTRHQKKLGCARPALMYTFRKRELVMAKIFS